MSETTDIQSGRLRVLPMFAGLFVALTLLLGAVIVAHFYVDYRAERTLRDARESLNVELARRALAADIAAVTTDLMFLGSLVESLSFEPVVAEGRTRYLEEIFLTFAREKGLYDQIRFLDIRGHEVVRINLGDGNPELVEADGLRDKSGRYYVHKALRLGRGQVYLSPLDLNIEDGVVEQPINPVLRFATPVFDSGGRRQGLVVLNYLGDRLLDRFRQAAANIADRVQLLNGDGFWLSSPRPKEAWGFMFDRDDTFQRRFAGAWKKIEQEQAGQFVSVGGLFTFATVRPVEHAARALAPGGVPAAQPEVWNCLLYTSPSPRDLK